MRTHLIPALLLVGAVNSAAQTVQFGALGGITATDPDAFGRGESKRYVIGPSVEVRFLQGKIGIELDALYRRAGESFAFESGPPPPEYTGPPPVTRFYLRSRTNSWEFPLLGKYYFRSGQDRWRPFLGTGYVLRAQWRKAESTSYVQGESTPRNNTQSASTGPDIGATVIAGVEIKSVARMSFQPQIRYTRWSSHSDFTRPLNHVDIGLGLRF